MEMKIFRFLVTVFFVLYSYNVLGAELGISVDKNRVMEGDVVYLTISYTGDSNKTPDISKLQADFDVVSNSSSSSYSFVNGASSKLKKWTIGLIPKKRGIIKIKPVELDGLISNYQQIEVVELSDTVDIEDNSSIDGYLKISTTVDEKNPILQQQITLWVNIYDSFGINDGTINISEEDKDNWIISPLMQNPIVSQKIIDGKYFNIISLGYALFPLKSGRLKLPQFVFDGYIVKNNEFNFPTFDDDFFGFNVNFNNVFGTKIPVKAKTKEEYINIKPIPDEMNKKEWIVAKNLKIKSSLLDEAKIKVGDAFSRKIEITAYGLPKTLFPVLSFGDIDGLKQYPEKPEIIEEIIDNEVVTKAIFNITYIPNKSGEINIPKIEIDWYCTETNMMKKSFSNSHNIEVYPDANLVKKQEKQKAEKVVPLNNNNNIEKNTKNSENINVIEKKEVITNVFFLALIILLLILIMLFMKKSSPDKKRNYKSLVVKAIEQHDLRLAKQYILEWAKEKFDNPNIQNFKTISDIIKDVEFSEQLNSLNKALYSCNDVLFESKKFIEIFLKVDKMKLRKNKNIEILPNLYD